MMKLVIALMLIGACSIGGGLATLPFLFDLAHKTSLISVDQLVDMIAISQSTPGPIGINVATFVGAQNYGILGGVIASIALVLPAFGLVFIISKGLDKYRDNDYVQKFFKLARPVSLGFMIYGLVMLMNKSISTGFDLILMVIGFLALRRWKIHPLIFIAASAVLGCVLFG